MPDCWKNDVILVRYPFSDLSATKIRPAVVVSRRHASQDLIVVPLTSRTTILLEGEFVLSDWRAAGLNVRSMVKRGLYTVHPRLVVKAIGQLAPGDAQELERSLFAWLGMRSG